MIIITRQEKGNYLLSIEILSGPNKVYLYLTLTLRNFTSPKNLHLSYIPRLRVFSIRVDSSKELPECILPFFFQFLLFMGLSCNQLPLSLSLIYPWVKLHLFYFKAKILLFQFNIQKQRTQNMKKFSGPNIKILHFVRYLFVIYTFLSQIAAFT